MCRRVGSLISLQKCITVRMCADIHLCILYRGENRKSFEYWILCSVPIFSLVWVSCVDFDGLVSLIFLCSSFSSSTFLWDVNWTLPSVLPNHQCLWCLVFTEGRSTCHSLAVVSPLPSLCVYGRVGSVCSQSLCCTFSCSGLSSIPSCLVCPRDMTRLCFVLVPCKVLTLSSSLLEFCVLWEGGHAVDCPRKARVVMLREVLVSVVSLWPWFWPKGCSVLKADAQTLLSCVW